MNPVSDFFRRATEQSESGTPVQVHSTQPERAKKMAKALAVAALVMFAGESAAAERLAVICTPIAQEAVRTIVSCAVPNSGSRQFNNASQGVNQGANTMGRVASRVDRFGREDNVIRQAGQVLGALGDVGSFMGGNSRRAEQAERAQQLANTQAQNLQQRIDQNAEAAQFAKAKLDNQILTLQERAQANPKQAATYNSQIRNLELQRERLEPKPVPIPANCTTQQVSSSVDQGALASAVAAGQAQDPALQAHLASGGTWDTFPVRQPAGMSCEVNDVSGPGM